ncbi:MAG: hypothetical protein ACRDAG_03040 [Cetobacterium somerae]|jgi:hypothetical protein|uniref:Uncharacterized protein n=1 Tax=Cetobacterium somerae ATCC BAA-474 TaxID=1319815 RepID=U7V9R7_9FUSO|nr:MULTISPECIES: hypothetical protein [Cetobacterium]ERT67884.1 hypothetical protein HMPREF0202_02206 [Cetobacterium somerae ATCC BAA-474]MBC2854725.1 hypothetical protein [Cetobacterium sp. 2G large]MCQ9628276.1 hypothetical protein [Cetobacterium somerae]WVJ02425.1 hypothetical protein VSU16_12955 [Cetobacterium somerae]
MKKGILMLLLLLSSLSYASWWGGLNGGTRAAIVTGSALILGSQYNQSEYRHQQDLRRLDTQIRRGYERQAVIENANRKYGNIGAPQNFYGNPSPNYQQYNQGRRQGARVIYSDQRSQILEMADGTRVILNQ